MGPGFGDFLTQIPPFIFVLFGVSGALAIMLVVVSVATRLRGGQAVVGVAPRVSRPGARPYDEDLPDLSLLLDDTAPTRRTGVVAVRLADGAPRDAAEVLALLRDVQTGDLLVQLGDQVYPAHARDAMPAEAHARLDALLAELGATRPAASPVAAGPASVVPARAAAPQPGDLPSFRLEDNPMPADLRGRRTAPPAIPELDLAGAIEAFLQHKLISTGAFAGRSIHVRRADDGGVRIEVDGRRYESVSDVADDDVRAYLSETIQEWQSRQ